MVRLSKLADYGIVIMAHMAGLPLQQFQARDLALETQVPLPTVSKLLKILTKHELLQSKRGVRGGYVLAKSPSAITVAELIFALEGPIALTQCNLNHDSCKTETNCAIRAPWQRINQVVKQALDSIKLSDLVNYPEWNKRNNGVSNVIKFKTN